MNFVKTLTACAGLAALALTGCSDTSSNSDSGSGDATENAAVGVDYTLIELDECGERRNGDVQQILKSINGCKTVPNVIAAGTFIGGGDAIAALQRKGELRGMLEQAGCSFSGKQARQ